MKELRRVLNKKLADRQTAISNITAEEKLLEQHELQSQHVVTAQSCVQQIAQATQQQSHKQIARIVSKCLSAVFEQPYELRIEFERKRGRTEAVFNYLRDGRKLNPRLTSGGVMDVTALALRLTSLVLTVPPARRLLVLDEPFAGLSSTNLNKMAVLIQTLAKELAVQFLIVTHDPQLEIGRVIELA